MAEKVHLTPNYFSQCFHESIGMSFQNYLQNLRIEQAYKLIKASKLTVTEICFSCGFNSLPYFITTFKKRYGESPGQVRKSK